MAACAVYPLYTGGLESEVVGLVGNVLTLAFAAWIAVTVSGAHRTTTRLLLAPVIAWMSFAVVLTAASL